MSKQLLAGVIFLVILTAQSSCILFKKGKRTILPADTTSIAVIPVDTTKPLDTINLTRTNLINALTPYWNRTIAFNTFSGKAKMRFEGKGQKHEFVSVFRIKKNEVIWASITALGGIVQVARIYITPDTLKLINYLEKEVTIMPLSDASKLLPLPADFSTLQNLIMGNVLRNSGNITDAADLGNLLALQVEDSGIAQRLNFSKADTTVSNIQMRSTSLSGLTGVIQLSDYNVLAGQKFSNNREINVTNSGDQYYLEMNFNKADIDQPVDVPFNIPKNYKIK